MAQLRPQPVEHGGRSKGRKESSQPKLFLVGGGELAELGDSGGDDFERGGDFLLSGVAAEAETDGGASLLGREADGG